MSARPVRTAAQSAQSAIQYFAGKDAAAEEERERAIRNIQCYDISSDSEDAAPDDEDHADSEADYSGSQSSGLADDDDEEGSRAQDDELDGVEESEEEEPTEEEAVAPVSDDEEDDGLEDLATAHGSSALVVGRPKVQDKLSSLPLEVRYLILSHLDRDPYAILCMKQISRQWYNTLNHGPGADHLWWLRCRAVEPTRQLRARGCKTWRESFIRIMKRRCMRCLQPTTAVFGTVWPEGPDWAVVCLKCQWTSPMHHCIIEADAITLGAKRGTLNRLPYKWRHRKKRWHKEYLYRSALGQLPTPTIMQRQRTRRLQAYEVPSHSTAKKMNKKQRKEAKRLAWEEKRRAKDAIKQQKQDMQRERDAKKTELRKLAKREGFAQMHNTSTSPYYAILQAYKGSRDLVLSAVECASRLKSSKLYFLANQVHKHGAIATSDYAAAFVEHFIDILEVKAELERRLASFPTDKKRRARALLQRKPNFRDTSIHTWLDYLATKEIDYQTYLDEVDGRRKDHFEDFYHGIMTQAASNLLPSTAMSALHNPRKCFGSAIHCLNQPSPVCPNKSCRTHCPGCVKHGGQAMPVNPR